MQNGQWMWMGVQSAGMIGMGGMLQKPAWVQWQHITTTTNNNSTFFCMQLTVPSERLKTAACVESIKLLCSAIQIPLSAVSIIIISICTCNACVYWSINKTCACDQLPLQRKRVLSSNTSNTHPLLFVFFLLLNDPWSNDGEVLFTERKQQQT